MKPARLRVLIVDDEKPARTRLKRLLDAYPEVEVIGEAEDGLSALGEIARLAPDVVFLDIEMPELDGIGVAKSLGIKGPSIVFVTAYDAYALKAFEANAVDYVVKPVAEERLSQTIEKLLHRRTQTRQSTQATLQTLAADSRFAVKVGAKFVVCDPKKIAAIVAKDHYATLLVDGRELLADDSLEVFEGRLNPEYFLRVHRSAIVNLDFIHELEREGDRKYTAILSDPKKTRIPISRERLQELQARLRLV